MTISNIKCNSDIEEFLKESNYIEREYSDQALTDAKLAWMIATTSHNKIDIKSILAIHKTLMNNINPRIAGRFRECGVIIGGQIKKFYSREIIFGQVAGWLKFYNKLQSGGEDFCKKAHVDFENIHPFEDGNGRVGRILYNIHRLNCGLPLHIIHE